MLVIGEKEQTAGTVAVRSRSEKELGAMPADGFVQKLEREVASRAL
jgi:threonyl-tRNA synthetase